MALPVFGIVHERENIGKIEKMGKSRRMHLQRKRVLTATWYQRSVVQFLREIVCRVRSIEIGFVV